MEKPSRGGEKRTAVWASPHEGRGSDGAVAPPLCDHRVVLHRCVVREWCTPSGSTVATCLHAAARTRRAARAVKGDVVSVWQVLHGAPSAPPMPAQRVARFDDHCSHNCLLKNKLLQIYSRFIRVDLKYPGGGPDAQSLGYAGQHADDQLHRQAFAMKEGAVRFQKGRCFRAVDCYVRG